MNQKPNFAHVLVPICVYCSKLYVCGAVPPPSCHSSSSLFGHVSVPVKLGRVLWHVLLPVGGAPADPRRAPAAGIAPGGVHALAVHVVHDVEVAHLVLVGRAHVGHIVTVAFLLMQTQQEASGSKGFFQQGCQFYKVKRSQTV